MSNINLRRFVDINFKYHTSSTTTSIRDTVVLLSTETLPAFASNRDSKYASRYDVFASLSEWLEYVEASNLDVSTSGAGYKTDAYVRVFFANNGNKVRIMPSVGTTATTITTLIKDLPDEQIVIAYTGSESVMKQVAIARAGDATVYGIKDKLIISNVTTNAVSALTDDDAIEKFVLKATNTLGTEMTIAGYLSNIDIYGINTVQDYDFTREYDYTNYNGDTISIVENNDDTILEACTSKHCNVIMKVAQASRNLGGDCMDGRDLVNEFMLIVLQQTLTERLTILLASKIKGASGISSIHSVIDDEMNKYVSNGYLTTDELWTDKDLTVIYNGQSYTVIAQGDALLTGYKATIIPYNALTDADKLSRKVPPIYIVLADSYGIRTITIDGEII